MRKEKQSHLRALTIENVKNSISVLLRIATQVQQQQQQAAPLKENSGTISWKLNSGFHPSHNGNRLICELKHMKLKTIKRSEKGTNESVMDEKFALLFDCNLQINNTLFHVSCFEVIQG